MLVLSRADVQRLLTLGPLIDAVEVAHASLALGQATQTVEHATSLPGGDAVMLPMAAALAALPPELHWLAGSKLPGVGAAIAGVKVLTDAPGNRARDLQTQHSTISVVDPITGVPLGYLDGIEITRQRTAATSAVATRHLARKDARVLGLIGAGQLAHTHLAAMLAVRDFDRVLVWSRSPATVEEFRAAASARHDIEIIAAGDPETVVRGADVLCTLTPSREPLVRGAWFSPGLHVNAVGAPPRPDHREIDTDGVLASRLIVDDLDAATTRSGEVCVPIAEGALDPSQILAELGDVIIGRVPGRASASDVTMFNSVGLAIQDMAAARYLLALAGEQHAGVSLDLVSPPESADRIQNGRVALDMGTMAR